MDCDRREDCLGLDMRLVDFLEGGTSCIPSGVDRLLNVQLSLDDCSMWVSFIGLSSISDVSNLGCFDVVSIALLSLRVFPCIRLVVLLVTFPSFGLSVISMLVSLSGLTPFVRIVARVIWVKDMHNLWVLNLYIAFFHAS